MTAATVARRSATALTLLICLLATLAVAGPGTARAGWSPPFELTTPGTLDYFGPELALSGGGQSTAAYSIGNVDVPGTWQAYLVGRSSSGLVGQPRAIAGVQQVLSMTYTDGSLELLGGAAPRNLDCCSSVQAIQVNGAGVAQRPRTLVSGLTGATAAQLLALADGQLTAAIATERGVWVVQAARGNRFGNPHRISNAGQEPINLTAAALGGESSIVAWTAGTGIIGAATPRSIFYATGSRRAAPNHTRVAFTAASGHRIDELGVVRHGRGATLAWIESWYDGHGGYHSQVRAADLAHGAGVRNLSPGGRFASDLSFASDAGGDEAAAWESCSGAGTCTVQAAGRPAGGAFGPARTLGAIDGDQVPSLAIGPSGRVVVGWVRGGQPVASVGFGAPTTLSGSTYANDPAVAVTSGNRAIEAWTQGTLNPSVVAAVFH